MLRSLTPVVIVLAALGWTTLVQTPVIAQPGPADPPPGAGLEIMQRICTSCHRIDFITAVPRDRAAWNDTVMDMVNRGASATPEEIEEVVAYLATNFPVKRD